MCKENIEKLINEKEIQFRDFKIVNVENRKTDGKEELILEGLACSFEKETVLYRGNTYECREKISRDAFKNCDMSDVIFNFNHTGRVYARTRNNSLSLQVKENGLYMRAVLMPEDVGHVQLYRDIENGLIDKMSFAFHVKESSYEYIERADAPTVEIRTVTEIDKLYDVSAVDIPAYDTTFISARKFFDAERCKFEELRIEKERLLRIWKGQ